MKNLTLITILSLFVSNCTSGQNQEKVQNVKDTIVVKDFRILVSVPFSGDWVNVDYLNSLLETRSPRTAQPYFKFISIPPETFQYASAVGIFRSSNLGIRIFKSGNNNYDFELWCAERNIHFGIKIISDDKIKIGDDYFTKVSEFKQGNPPFGWRAIISGILFGGKYTDGNNMIEFHSDGKITGLERFSTYSLSSFFHYDYVEGRNVDEIHFDWEKPDNQIFAFKFDTDTLLIYEWKCLEYKIFSEGGHYYEQCVNYDFGELKYKLWKNK